MTHDDPGLWSWVAPHPARREGRPALFVDRDGVLVADTDFLSRPEEVVLLSGAAQTLASFNAADIPVIVVTNQSGVSRGYFTWEAVADVEAEVRRQLAEGGAHLDATFACGYHTDGDGRLALRDHEWRKPRPGMLVAAAALLGVSLQTSWVVGDRARDLEAGRAAGVAGGVHVRTGYGDRERDASGALARPGFDVRFAEDVRGAQFLVEPMIRLRGC